jgi:hypothetical protein
VCRNCLFLDYSAKKKKNNLLGTSGEGPWSCISFWKKHTQTTGVSLFPSFFLSSILRLLNKKNCKSFFSFFFFYATLFSFCVSENWPFFHPSIPKSLFVRRFFRLLFRCSLPERKTIREKFKYWNMFVCLIVCFFFFFK